MKKYLVFWILALVRMTCFAAPSVQMRTEASPKEIHIGDIIKYQTTVTYSTGVTSQPLILSTSSLGEFELIDVQSAAPKSEKDKLSQTHQLLLTTFSTGSQTIPALKLSFILPEGTVAEVDTEPLKINVKSLLDEKGDLGDLRPPKGLYNFRSYLWLWILLGVLALGVLIYGGIKWRSKHSGKHAHPLEPPKPAEESAWDALKRLEEGSLLIDGQFKEYYVELTSILRRYLEDRYQFAAMERTTAELTIEFRRLNFSNDLAMLLREVFVDGDLVKFAKFTPTSEEALSDLDRVKQIVTLTTPIKPTESEEKIPV